MGTYRVYRAGEDEHVREATTAVPDPLERGDGRPRRPRERGASHGGSATASPRWWLWALIVAAAVAAGLVYWFYGRDVIGNSKAALDLAKLSGKIPDWVVLGAPVIVVAAVALVTAYLAFGRLLAVKVVGVAVVVLVLATPGLAVGYANGLVDDLGKTEDTAATPADSGSYRRRR